MTTNSTNISGLNVSQMFADFQTAIAAKGNKIQSDMNDITAEGKELGQEQMLQMQFEINQYNTMLETVSTISKSLTDEAKQLAQRSQ